MKAFIDKCDGREVACENRYDASRFLALPGKARTDYLELHLCRTCRDRFDEKANPVWPKLGVK